MKVIFNIYRNLKNKLTIIIIVVVVFMLSSFIFIGNELLQNSIYFLRQEERQQQEYNDFLGAQLDGLYMQGVEVDKYIDFIKNNVPQSGSKWYYLAKGSSIIFLRDEATTNALGEYKDYSKFKCSYSKDKVIWTKVRFGENTYEVGTISSQEYLLNQAKVAKHIIYISIVVLICSVIYFILIVSFASFWYDVEQKNKKLEEQIVEANLRIEAVLSQLEQERKNKDWKILDQYHVYDSRMINTLLKKSNDKDLYPISILIVRVENYHSIHTKSLFNHMMRIVQNFLNSQQIMAETNKGEFTVLMYHTSKSMAQNIKELAFLEWNKGTDVQGLNLLVSIISTEDENHLSILEYYNNCIEKLELEERTE